MKATVFNGSPTMTGQNGNYDLQDSKGNITFLGYVTI